MDELTRLGDRLAVTDLLVRYATAIDTRRWDLLDSVFTSDARLDYRSAGGVEGPYPEVRAWLEQVLPMFEVTQHLVVNTTVEFEPGHDRARARTAFLNPNQLTVEDEPWTFVVGGNYHDRLVKADTGWRITSRVEETLWWQNPMPGLPPRPDPLPDGVEV